jgi:GH18 family chitinase
MPTDDGRFNAERLDEPTRELLRSLKAAAGCRVLVCIGGGGQSTGFSPLAADEDKRREFVRDLCAFCRTHEFDGVDYDWEHPEGEAELAAYADLLQHTKRGLGERGLVTVAQSPWRDFGRAVYDIVDRVHVMSYNHHHPQATLAAARDDVERMQEWGCPPEKLVLGVPFYGRDAAGKTRTYADLIRKRPAATAGDLLDGYAFNGAATVRAKTRLARELGLGGIMVWELGQDATEPALSLLESIREEARGRMP